MEEIMQRAILVGVDLNSDKNFEYSVEELRNLAEACNVEVVGLLTQKLERVNSACYIGTGKVEEVALLVAQNDANLVIFNDELSPSQIRNLEAGLQCKVIDRTIFCLLYTSLMLFHFHFLKSSYKYLCSLHIVIKRLIMLLSLTKLNVLEAF